MAARLCHESLVNQEIHLCGDCGGSHRFTALLVQTFLDFPQARLPQLIDELRPGEEIILTRGQAPVARLIGATAAMDRPRRQLGTLKGTVQ